MLTAGCRFLALVRGLLVLAVAPMATGCGQDAPGCSDVCPPLPAGSEGFTSACAQDCSQQQDRCASENGGGYFQELLTCISNAGGSYDMVPLLCQAADNAVSEACGG